MKEHYITYEQSVKLKELEFSGEVTGKYVDCPNDPTLFHGMRYQSWNLENDEILAPRLDQAQTWLREEKGIFVGVTYDNSMSNYNPYGFRVQIPMCNDRSALGFHEYNQALSAGIDKALELLTSDTDK